MKRKTPFSFHFRAKSKFGEAKCYESHSAMPLCPAKKWRYLFAEYFCKFRTLINRLFLLDGKDTAGADDEQCSGHEHHGGLRAAHQLQNAATTDGIEYLAAVSSFLAQRYSGLPLAGMYAKVDNFVIGNEVNAWRQWNYMNCGSMAAYTKQYADAFRVMYTGIKSTNSNANVYVCTDHQWGFSQRSVYGAKAFLTEFNNDIRSQGNIDWRLAFHAYNYPLTNAVAWAPTANVQRSQNTKYVSVYNIDVVTDFLCQADFLSPTGAVRTVKLSEQGYTSALSEEQQSVSIVYAIMVANNNSIIDGIIISREKDDPVVEIPQGLANGLLTTGNRSKSSYRFYQNAESAETIAEASAMAGVDLNTLLAPR